MRIKRRDFLKILGAATSATVLSSCGVEKATEKAIPILVPPTDDYIPGQAEYFHSTCTECPANCGVTVKTREMNAIKVEGIAGHPINEGKLCIRGQSSLMRLYHPQRVRHPLVKDAQGNFQEIGWQEAFKLVAEKMKEAGAAGRKNLYLAGRTTGSLSALISEFCASTRVERLPEYEVFSHANIRKANEMLFGRPEIPHYKIEDADYLLTIGSDILETFVSPVNYTRQITRAKKKRQFQWTHLEPYSSVTGFSAGKRMVVKPGSEVFLLAFIAKRLSKEAAFSRTIPFELADVIPDYTLTMVSEATGLEPAGINEMLESLIKAARPLVIAGAVSTANENGLLVAVLTSLIHWMTGAVGEVVDFASAENYDNVGSAADMAALATTLDEGRVGVLFCARVDLISDLPASFSIKEKLRKANFRVALTEVQNATARECDLILPISHAYESWGDTESRRGVLGLIQPSIEPVFNSRPEGDILLNIAAVYGNSQTVPAYEDWLFARWKKEFGADGVDKFLAKGFMERTPGAVEVKFNAKPAIQLFESKAVKIYEAGNMLLMVPSLRAFDGRSRALPLMDEIPDPVTTVSYGNWVGISKTSAGKLGVKDGDQVKIEWAEGNVWLPVKIQFGLPESVFTLQQGMARAISANFDERSGEIYFLFSGLQISKTGAKVRLPILSGSMELHGRDIIPLHKEEKKHGAQHFGEEGKIPSLYPPHEHKEYRWAMAIDLESCTGCSACVAACYIENNVPMVGLEEHLMGREMSWIRIEPFHDHDERLHFLPMLCQQCDNAPCEPVCPVYATHHNSEGLNVQVYNRCVGTRYCSNNCPYKVRRFNWFDHERPEPLNRLVNPALSVRTRGVMEKCTFCIQRIREAKDMAKDEDRKVRDGELVPACAQTCPTDAITFGNILDKNSRVYKLAHSERAYRVFEEFGTQPSVYYLRKQES